MCKGNHLDKYCFWQHPELIKNPTLRASQQAAINKYNATNSAALNCTADTSDDRDDDNDDSDEGSCLAYACFRSQCEMRCNCGHEALESQLFCQEVCEYLSSESSDLDTMEATRDFLFEETTRATIKQKAEDRRQRKASMKARIAKSRQQAEKVSTPIMEIFQPRKKVLSTAAPSAKTKARVKTVTPAKKVPTISHGPSHPDRTHDANHESGVQDGVGVVRTSLSTAMNSQNALVENASPLVNSADIEDLSPAHNHVSDQPQSRIGDAHQDSLEEAAAFAVETQLAGHVKGSPQTERRADYFIVDSGATHSVCHNRGAFEEIDFTQEVTLYSGANLRTKSEGIGTIKIHVTTDSGNEVELRREGVIYCPEFKVNLLSVRKEINDYGSTLSFSHTPGGNSISLQNEEVVPFYDDGRNYRLSFATVTERTKAIQPRQTQRTSNAYAIHKIEDMSDLLLVHYRMAHASPAVCAVVEDHTHGLPKLKLSGKEKRQSLHELCQACGVMKSNRLASKQLIQEKEPEKWGDCVSTDLHGPLPPSFGDKYIYAICFVDHYTGYIQIYGMKEKTALAAATCLRAFLSDTAIFGPIYNLLSDGGREYLGQVQEFCDQRSIRQIPW